MTDEQKTEVKEETLIDKANSAAERIEKANAQAAEILRKQEELFARQRLGGTTSSEPHEEVKEESPKEYKERVMSGKL